MKTLAQEVLNIVDAVTARRAWDGNLRLVDKALSYLYKDMTQGDKDLKDSVFYKYYRYYNDGDKPRFELAKLKKLGLSDSDANTIADGPSPSKYGNNDAYELAMEKGLSVVMSYFLDKYFKDLNRAKFNYDNRKEAAKAIVDGDYKEEYWLKKYGTNYNIPELVKYAQDLEKLNKGVSYTKDFKSLPDSDVTKIKQLIRDDLLKAQAMVELSDLL